MFKYVPSCSLENEIDIIQYHWYICHDETYKMQYN